MPDARGGLVLQIKPMVQSLIYCALEPLAASINPLNDHWVIRDYATRLIADVIRYPPSCLTFCLTLYFTLKLTLTSTLIDGGDVEDMLSLCSIWLEFGFGSSFPGCHKGSSVPPWCDGCHVQELFRGCMCDRKKTSPLLHGWFENLTSA